MKRPVKALGVALVTLMIAACASPQRGPSNAVIQRVLAKAPGAAQPSTIVKTELAYARAAKEQGFAKAALEFAAPGALIHLRNGAVPLQAIAPALEEAGLETQWGPRLVVKSCDGSMALSQGRFVDGEGKVGNYVTAWRQQNDLSYKWTYDVAGLDNPQPPPRAEFEDGDIVVTALETVQGLVATCPEERLPLAALRSDSPVGEAADARISRDGTLRWRWEHRGENEKYVVAEYFYNGEWVTAIEEVLASPFEG